MKRSMILVLFISCFAVLSDCSNSWSKGKKTKWHIPVYMGPWSQNEPKDIYYQNNNRFDRQKHAQFNQHVHQPRKHNHGIRHNHRRNQ